ncbi:hypothetical protein OUZ56_017410, partial [Daphnia magna]
VRPTRTSEQEVEMRVYIEETNTTPTPDQHGKEKRKNKSPETMHTARAAKRTDTIRLRAEDASAMK